jgi:hypothetical protein
MKKNITSSVFLLVSSIGAYFFAPMAALGATATAVASPFSYNFTVDGSLVEASSVNLSTSGYWWVNSGARMYLSGGSGKTVHGSLPASDYWRTLYASNNPTDTDNGYHPQNIFRLVGRSLWSDFRQEAYFRIAADNLSASPNRNASNGILLFNRYKDSSTLYYTGLRVDGNAIIKKKLKGTYYTLASVKVFPGTYSASSNPNLLPKNQEIGLRSEVSTIAGKVTIKVYSDVGKTGTWTLVAQAVDDGSKYGPIIDGAGFGGIRTDFMDVSFDNYKMQQL